MLRLNDHVLEIYMLSCIINLLTSDPEYVQMETGVKKGNLYMSYTSIYEDVRAARDWMHQVSSAFVF